MGYTQVDDTCYWSGDAREGMRFNELAARREKNESYDEGRNAFVPRAHQLPAVPLHPVSAAASASGKTTANAPIILVFPMNASSIPEVSQVRRSRHQARPQAAHVALAYRLD